jgi:E2F/DP family winged-helix DNA-binding domain
MSCQGKATNPILCHSRQQCLDLFALAEPIVLQVVEKVSQKGCTTYQSIADELILELQQYKRLQVDGGYPGSPRSNKRKRASDQLPLAEDDGEKNVRRRVYDSLNVLKAVGAVVPLKGLTGTARKEVLWVGLPGNLAEVHVGTQMQEELKQHVREVQQTQEQVQVRARSARSPCLRQYISESFSSARREAPLLVSRMLRASSALMQATAQRLTPATTGPRLVCRHCSRSMSCCAASSSATRRSGRRARTATTTPSSPCPSSSCRLAHSP